MNNRNDEAVIEALTLTCEIDKLGAKRYRNKEGKLHRIHGPAMIYTDGSEFWYKNGSPHRENGPAIMWGNRNEAYYINGKWLTKDEFIRWQKKNGIEPIE